MNRDKWLDPVFMPKWWFYLSAILFGCAMATCILIIIWALK